jgi:hypothetical protein
LRRNLRILYATKEPVADPITLSLPFSLVSIWRLPCPTQMDYAGLFAAERGFVSDVAVLAELPDISEIGIPAADFGKADHLMGENHQRLPVLPSGPALQQSGINADMSAADPRVSGNSFKKTMQKR